jgi:spore germination protein YaaH
VVDKGGFDGVNVDFEYMSDPIRILNSDMIEMFEEMKKVGWGEINVDVFANTVIKGDEERLKKLAQVVDGVVVMAYDFARPGSDNASAVAPIEAVEGKRSIEEIINRINIGNLPKDKFILAYPLYGYLWETTKGEMNSATMANGYGVTVLYKDGIGYTGGVFDNMAKSPWYAWTEKEQHYRIVRKKVVKYYKNVRQYYTIDQWHQAYLENEESLKIKIEITKQEKLGGTGFWALGYEGKESNLIEVLIK